MRSSGIDGGRSWPGCSLARNRRGCRNAAWQHGWPEESVRAEMAGWTSS
ncbi:MAG TPA: hypothetical protein VMY43_04560 [Methanothrix sp.]|nr:hypothetical protein [Methanothrix sp.]